MKNPVVIYSVAFGLSVTPLQAGVVITLAASPEYTGKLTLNTETIHVEGASPADINLSDILEADFTDGPFQLDYFATNTGETGPFPANWKALDYGPAGIPGKVTYADGTLALSGDGTDAKAKGPEAKYFFVGRPWTGDGQWTARVKEVDAQTPHTVVGLMLRDGLDASSGQLSLGATAQVTGRQMSGPMAALQWGLDSSEKKSHASHQPPVSIQLPVWLRLSRSGDNIDASVSSDGKQWDVIGQHDIKSWTATWIGFFLDSREAGTVGKAVLDQVSFTPEPGLTQTLPAGVLLQSGSFLAGSFAQLNLAPGNTDANGMFRRAGNSIPIPSSKVAVVVLLPTARSQVADANSQVGLIMKNGDFLEGTPMGVSGVGVRISSVLLGMLSYSQKEARACVLRPLQPQSAPYEIRLNDGSTIRASSLSASNGHVGIGEVSGINLTVAQDEIAQFRAGPAQAQSMLELAWKATPPPAPAPPAANPAPALAPAPAANPAQGQAPPVQCWEGNNQEQIMMAPTETAVDFPLNGKYHAMAMRAALSPDSPPNSEAVIRILADGREIGRTPAFKAGEQPRFVEITFQNTKTVTLVADSPFAGARVLFIDPVALR